MPGGINYQGRVENCTKSYFDGFNSTYFLLGGNYNASEEELVKMVTYPWVTLNEGARDLKEN